jgi:2-keto-4-pentenoate hydratase/2-oxohepta-3-ene-1,7-dioic acid hydratase in catechol pathway
MKIVRFNATGEPVTRARTGVLLAKDIVGDLRAGCAGYLVDHVKDIQGREIAALRIPLDVRQILHNGPARQAIEHAAAWLAEQHRKDAGKGVDGEPLFFPLAAVRLHNPLKPSRLVIVAGNMGPGSSKPMVANRAPASVMGPVRDVAMPAALKHLVYGTGLAIVMARNCHGIEPREVPSAIAGYMAANEVHAAADTEDLDGDVGFRRCIIGPALVDAGDIRDLSSVRIMTRVNGNVVQSGTLAALRWPVDKLIARLSRHGLETGDVIVTGLLSDSGPAGGATMPYLRDGDLLESELEGIGTMRNRVVAER